MRVTIRTEEAVMASTNLDLGGELGAVLEGLGQPVEQAAREMIVMELYRRSLISSGKAALLLGLNRLDFIRRASELGIPYFRLAEDEWQTEVAESKRG
jgi:predicted HTH domain antitoxin